MNDIEEQAAKLLEELDISKLKDGAKRTNILLQKQLQELMLIYVVDIRRQLALKQEDAVSNYPSDLISSLKIIADLYLKMKEINKLAQVEEEKDAYSNKYVF